MRTEILQQVQALNLGSVTATAELPWTDGGVPLYQKNLKKIYVDLDNTEVEPFLQTLNGVNISNEVVSVRLYFACDAKVLIPNYEDIITSLKAVRNTTSITAVQRRECLVSTTVENDVLVTELEYRFTKLLT